MNKIRLKRYTIKKTAFILLLIVVVLQSYIYCKTYIFLYNSDVILRVSFHELKYMFHAEYEYYIIGQNASCRISESMAKRYFGEKIEERSMYNDQDTVCWSVSLDYSEGRNYDFNKDESYLRTSFGDQYRICYRNWGGQEINPSEREIEVMRQVTESLFNGNTDNWIANYEDGCILISFLLIRHGEKYLVKTQDHDKKLLLRVTENGAIKKVLELSEGNLDYINFYRTN